MGELVFHSGDNSVLRGKTKIRLKAWHHVVAVRFGRSVKVYLNGNTTPEIAGALAMGFPKRLSRVCIGGRSDGYAGFEGKIDEVSLYGRVLTAEEVARHYAAARGTN